MKLEVIAKENDFFQAELYKNSQTVIERKKNQSYNNKKAQFGNSYITRKLYETKY